MAELQELAGLKYQLGINSPFLQRPFFMHLVYPPPPPPPPQNFAEQLSSISLGMTVTLFEGLIFGGTFIRRDLSTEGNLRFKTNWVSLIVGSKFTIFALF